MDSWHKPTSRPSQDGAGVTLGTGRVRRTRIRYSASPCRWCGEPYVPVDLKQEFCSPEHKKLWMNLAMTRGMQLYELVMEWRLLRRNNLISAVCALVSRWMWDDREAGRKYRPRVFQANKGQRVHSVDGGR